MKYIKKNLPVEDARQILEPGPIVLVSSRWKNHHNIMTMGWHTVMEFAPSLIGCIISSSNHSFDLIRKSKECVINVPSFELANIVIGIGNCSGKQIDKFNKFGLTQLSASKVDAPIIKECFANFECRLHDTRLIKQYNFFVFEIVKAHIATVPKYPTTMHYHGKGIFSKSGNIVNLSKKFTNKDLLKR